MIKLYSGKVLGKPIDIGEFIPLNILKLSIEREEKMHEIRRFVVMQTKIDVAIRKLVAIIMHVFNLIE